MEEVRWLKEAERVRQEELAEEQQLEAKIAKAEVERKRLEVEAEVERRRLEVEVEVERKRVEEEAETEEQLQQWEEARKRDRKENLVRREHLAGKRRQELEGKYIILQFRAN